jgi:cation diffusion facilitator CzcD-associated flavoprotein CzcO
MATPTEDHDLVILGAGMSGINAAHVFQREFPHRKLTILEARGVTGGTWSFFRYPGFRSDSDITVFGLPWYPWTLPNKVALGPQIAKYIEDASRADGSYDKILFHHRMVACEWHSEDHAWHIHVDVNGKRKLIRANFVLSCTGYYSYERSFPVEIPGLDSFQGQVIHPQWWPEDLDYAGKRIIVVGSGATSVTLLPSLAEKAKHVTVLQRSPSYVAVVSNRSRFDEMLRWLLPVTWVHWFCWLRDNIYEYVMIALISSFPRAGRALLRFGIKSELPKDIDVDVHFNPRYNPFDQRLCMCPDGDYFKALHQDNCDIVTDIVDTVTSDGILLKSGRKLEADMIITATGLYFQLLGGIRPLVDGREIDPGKHYAWRGCMLDSLPNMVFTMGYTTSTFTPGAAAMTQMAVRVVRHMEKKKATSVVPVIEKWEGMPQIPAAADTSSSYFVKAGDRMPKVTNKGPCYGRKSLLYDAWALLFANMEDGLVYSNLKSE